MRRKANTQDRNISRAKRSTILAAAVSRDDLQDLENPHVEELLNRTFAIFVCINGIIMQAAPSSVVTHANADGVWLQQHERLGRASSAGPAGAVCMFPSAHIFQCSHRYLAVIFVCTNGIIIQTAPAVWSQLPVPMS